MLVTFHEVDVFIEAETPRAAYLKLQEALGTDDIEFDSYNYSTDQNGVVKSAQELWELGDSL